MTAKNPSRDAIIDELSKYGIRPLGTGHGGAHPYVEFAAPNGMKMKIPHTTNGREGRGRRLGNYAAIVRRAMRRLGVNPVGPEIPVRSKPIEIGRKPLPVRVPPPAPAEQPSILASPSHQEAIMTIEAPKKRVHEDDPLAGHRVQQMA